MALFVDGPATTVDDLSNQDSGLLEVAEACSINVTTKLSLAHEELEGELQLWLNRSRPTQELILLPTLRIDQVVMTAPLKKWETMTALAMFYRDAYFSQLVDRYEARWNEYSRLRRDAYEQFLASGLGIVSTPVRRALPAELGSMQAPQQGGTFYASVAWVNAIGQEGAASTAASIVIADNQLMTVAAASPPANAIGFNVYAGNSLTGMTGQNDIPLAVSDSFVYVPGFRTQGRAPDTGQRPDYIRPLARTLLRG